MSVKAMEKRLKYINEEIKRLEEELKGYKKQEQDLGFKIILALTNQ